MPKIIEMVVEENRTRLMGIPGAKGISIKGRGANEHIIVHVNKKDPVAQTEAEKLKKDLDGYRIELSTD